MLPLLGFSVSQDLGSLDLTLDYEFFREDLWVFHVIQWAH